MTTLKRPRNSTRRDSIVVPLLVPLLRPSERAAMHLEAGFCFSARKRRKYVTFLKIAQGKSTETARKNLDSPAFDCLGQ